MDTLFSGGAQPPLEAPRVLGRETEWLMTRYSARGQRLRPPEITGLMKTALDNPELLSLAAGFTDTESLPAGPVSRIVQDLTERQGPPEHLQYGTNQGRPGLRRLLSHRLEEWDGCRRDSMHPDRIFITNGSQQGLALASEVLCDAGDIVLVEQPTYFVYLDVARSLGLDLRPLPTDPGSGKLDPQALTSLLANLRTEGESERLKAVYLVSYFSNPSSRSMSREDKAILAEALQEAKLTPVILEDAAYRDLYFHTSPTAPSVLSLPEYEPFPRLYFGTLTKPFATGLKVGYACSSDEELRDRILYLKGAHDFGTANFNQAVLEVALQSGELDAHLGGLRDRYRCKMKVLHAALRNEGLPEAGWAWEEPEGGLYLWLQAPPGVDTAMGSPFWAAALDAGVLYVPGDLCFPTPTDTCFVRLSFGVLQEEGLQEAARRFGEAARAVVRG